MRKLKVETLAKGDVVKIRWTGEASSSPEAPFVVECLAKKSPHCREFDFYSVSRLDEMGGRTGQTMDIQRSELVLEKRGW